MKKIKFEYKIVFFYLLLGFLWILFSDKLVLYFVQDEVVINKLQLYKGWFYVAVTAIIFYLFLARYMKRIRRSKEKLRSKNDSLVTTKKDLKDLNEDYYSLLEEYKSQNEDLWEAKKENEKVINNLSSILNSAPEAIFIQHNFKIEYFNEHFIELLGLKEKTNLLGKNIEDFIHKDSLLEVKNVIKDLKGEDKSIANCDCKLVNHQGDTVFANLSAVTIEYNNKNCGLVFIKDVTEQKRYINEIEKNNQFISTVLDNLPIGIALNNMDEGTATYINNKFSEIYGWPKDDLRDLATFFKKVYPDKEYREKVYSQIQKDIDSKDQSRMHWENVKVTRKNGEIRYVNTVNIPLFEQNTMVSTVMDVTPLIENSNKLIEAKEKAQESDNLKTAFLNNISHEFRTPLNGIIGFTELLTEHDCSEEQRKLYRNAISESGKRLANLITDTVEISKVQSNQLSVNISECNVAEYCEELNDDYIAKFESKNINFSFNIDNDIRDVVFVTDCLKLKRIIVHLFENAYKFTREGFVKANCKLQDNKFFFTIEDSGIGIDDEIQETIFKPFYHIKERSYSGCGLGLSIIKAYLDKLNGTINIDSKVDRGTLIELIIPVKIINSKISNNNGFKKLNAFKLKVLVAEDESFNFLLLEEILKSYNFEVHRANNGKEAVKLVESVNDFDLILMDIKMPEMSGYEATKIIREKGFKIPIIAQSAYFLEKDFPKLKNMGFDDVIIKPIKKAKLTEKIEKHINKNNE